MCTSIEHKRSNMIIQIKSIEIEDLPYIEQDLHYYQLVSLGFLLFGDDRANAEYLLQKLLICSHAINENQKYDADLLRKYAIVNPTNWHSYLIEALAIIGAKRVIRKIGLEWLEIRQHYLPHITEISLCVHPLLKCLYKMCERMTSLQAGRIVQHINETCQRNNNEHLRFYDFSYLEIFLLDWLTRGVIILGDFVSKKPNIDILLQYFKLNEMDDMKRLLLDTINSNTYFVDHDTTEKEIATTSKENFTENVTITSTTTTTTTTPTTTTTAAAVAKLSLDNVSITRTCTLTPNECYDIKRERAGILLIINQKEFHEEQNEEFKDLLPEVKLRLRTGTDVDKMKLINVFTSFGYEPYEHENLTSIQMLHVIRETMKRSLLNDSLIVCILSHGIDGAVYGANSIPVKITDIEKIITADTLQGKPKMLIIQACQKTEHPMCVRSHFGVQNTTADAFMDMIKAMSTVPGYASLRHTIEGTWFIQELCNAVDRYGDIKHMLDILVIVQRIVSGKRGDQNEVMVPITSYTLRKYFFLPPRNIESGI